MNWKCILASAALAVALTPTTSFADSITSVEGARAKERQGRWLDRQDREQLRRYGGNDDYRGYYGYGSYYDDGYYDDGPGVRVYIGPY